MPETFFAMKQKAELPSGREGRLLWQLFLRTGCRKGEGYHNCFTPPPRPLAVAVPIALIAAIAARSHHNSVGQQYLLSTSRCRLLILHTQVARAA